MILNNIDFTTCPNLLEQLIHHTDGKKKIQKILFQNPKTKESALCHFIQQLTKNIANGTIVETNPYKDYLYKCLAYACQHSMYNLLRYLISNFTFDLNYNPYLSESYFEVTKGTQLYQLLIKNYHDNVPSMNSKEDAHISFLNHTDLIEYDLLNQI